VPNPLIQDPGRIRDLSAAMAKGEITAETLVRRYLDRIAAVDGQVKAWIHVLADAALTEARALDAERKSGKLRGPLHGIPVGIKDVIDVRGLPTRANSPSRADIAPASADATVVAHLRAAGAIILGKLHTTEYAFFQSLPFGEHAGWVFGGFWCRHCSRHGALGAWHANRRQRQSARRLYRGLRVQALIALDRRGWGGAARALVRYCRRFWHQRTGCGVSGRRLRGGSSEACKPPCHHAAHCAAARPAD